MGLDLLISFCGAIVIILHWLETLCCLCVLWVMCCDPLKKKKTDLNFLMTRSVKKNPQNTEEICVVLLCCLQKMLGNLPVLPDDESIKQNVLTKKVDTFNNYMVMF